VAHEAIQDGLRKLAEELICVGSDDAVGSRLPPSMQTSDGTIPEPSMKFRSRELSSGPI